MKIIKLIITLLLFSSCVALTVLGNPDPAPKDYTISNEVFLKSWMSYIKPSTLLIDIIMPGSHDSGAYNMFKLAETQNSTIKEQLEGGVRYFDFRVDGGEGLYLYHNINSSNSFNDAAKDINEFVENNPTEFLILDFQHCRNNAHVQVVEVIEREMNPEAYALSGDIDLSTFTYENAQESNARYIVLLGGQIGQTSQEREMLLGYDYIHNRSNYLSSPYNSNNHIQGVEKIIESFSYYAAQRVDHKFFVLQAQTTMGLGLQPSFLFEEEFSDTLNHALSNFGTEKSSVSLENTNIIMRDYVLRNPQNIPSILALNLRKNIVKDPILFEKQIEQLIP